jgi:RNA polymerase sigma-70 factor (ECF subfamily)
VKEPKRLDDDALMRQMMAGDTQAFARLVQAHQQRLLRFAERLLGDADAAEDAVQEAFLRLWRGRERYHPQGTLTAFLLRIVRNLCLDYCRSQHATRPLDEANRVPAGSESGVESRTQDQALSAAVRQAVLALPEPQRVVFVLSQYERLSYREIAEVLGCPLGTVASRKYQALETLRRRLAPWMEEEKR